MLANECYSIRRGGRGRGQILKKMPNFILRSFSFWIKHDGHGFIKLALEVDQDLLTQYVYTDIQKYYI